MLVFEDRGSLTPVVCLDLCFTAFTFTSSNLHVCSVCVCVRTRVCVRVEDARDRHVGTLRGGNEAVTAVEYCGCFQWGEDKLASMAIPCYQSKFHYCKEDIYLE